MTDPAAMAGARPRPSLDELPNTWRDLRAVRGLSLRELEQRTRINRGELSKIDNGRLIPTPGQAAAILEACRVG